MDSTPFHPSKDAAMRRKLYFGVVLMAFASVVVGFTWNHTIGAQDAKKAEPEQKKSDQDLFDILRQKFEAKSDVPVAPPSKPMAPLPNLPLPTAQAPAQLPPPNGTPLAPIPGPTSQAPMPLPAPTPPSSGGSGAPIPGPTAEPKLLDEKKPGEVQLPTQQPLPPVTPPVQDLPKPAASVIQPKPPVVVDGPSAERFADPVAPTPVRFNEPIKLKGSAWSLYVELVNGQTVVTATVNKKHEFKIVCQGLDLQTGAGIMKAKGKVQITGDALNASCDQLTLPLHDDRLLLEGAAELRIQKTTTNVSDARPAAFELKGDKLDLRISELQSPAYIETSWRKVAGDSSEGRPIPAAMERGDDAKKWTPYGKLKLSNMKSNESENVWSLVASDGKVIAHVMARDGGSLEQYVGRTIAVFGAREGERGGSPVVRVTHIAVP
jgi:hypothetical protein